MKIVFVVLCCVFGNTFALELPLYFPQCVISDPNLNYCIKEAANIVIPNLVKGDADLGVPVTDPLYFSKAEIGGKKLKISLTDVYTYDFKKFRLTDAMFDLQNRNGSFTAVIDIGNTFADYSISNGQVLSRPVSGRGKIIITLVGAAIHYTTDIRIYVKDGEKHLKLINSTVKLAVNRAFFSFNGLHSSEKGQDISEFMDDNWRTIYAETKPSIEQYFTISVQSILNPIMEKVPLTTLFIP